MTQELKAYNVVATADVNPEVVDSLGCTEWAGYDKDEVDAVLAEKDKKIESLEKELEDIRMQGSPAQGEAHSRGSQLMALTKFNVNDYIRFEETEDTRRCVTRFYRALYKRPDVENHVNWFMNCHTKLVDGKPIMRMQFHEFAVTFGRYMIMGSAPCIKDNNFYFETEDGK